MILIRLFKLHLPVDTPTPNRFILPGQVLRAKCKAYNAHQDLQKEITRTRLHRRLKNKTGRVAAVRQIGWFDNKDEAGKQKLSAHPFAIIV